MSKSLTPLHRCPRPGCYRRTRAAFCSVCTQREQKRQRERAKLAKTPGTLANLGVDTFLAQVAERMAPLGFERIDPLPDTLDRTPDDCTVLVLRSEAADIRFEIRVGADDDYSPISGSTIFWHVGKQLSFDRLGVSDSFYGDKLSTPNTIADVMTMEIGRVDAARERRARSVPIPGLPGNWLITPERRAEITAILKAGKTASFTPSGFGIGYAVSRRKAHPYSKQLPRETAEFFDTLPSLLFYDTLDCD